MTIRIATLAGILALTTLGAPVLAQSWDQNQKLVPNDGAEFDGFGQAVAISEGLALIGSRGDDDNGFTSGSAYVFDVTTGNQLFKLLPIDGVAGDSFGLAVSISADRAVVGAPESDDQGDGSGSAYIFDSFTGEERIKLLANDGAAGDRFGWSVSISGDRAVVGANKNDDSGTNSGSAYVFDVSTGQQLAKLLPTSGAPFDEFGISVSVSGNVAVVGAFLDDDRGTDSGSAYVFDITSGQQVFKLLAADGAGGDQFGAAVAVSGNLAVIGAPGHDDNGAESGAAYIFDVTTGQQLLELKASDGATADFFGGSVSISGDFAAGGASSGDGNESSSGAAYVFDARTGEQLSKITASDGVGGDSFGNSVGLSGNLAVIGAPNDEDNGQGSGSAYVFSYSNCLELMVDNLIAGQNALFTISNGTTGTRAVTVYGTKSGQTVVNNVSGYCATFGIKGVTQSKVIGGLNQTFDVNGEIIFNQTIPGNASGAQVFFQSAMQDTCPDECISNLVQQTVQ